MQKSILVTGGSGFIGSHLCKSLLEIGSTVVCADNLTTGRKANIEDLVKNKNFKFIDLDVCDKEKLFAIETSFDEIYHLASPASVTYIVDHPVEAADVNSLGTKNLLELSVKNKAKFLFASSSEAYGDPNEHPQKESYWGNVNPVGVRSGYDEGKRFGEAITMAYKREYGLNSKIIRIFNTYGPNSNPNDSRIVPRFITEALKGDPITVHGDGSQTRSFCYVSDLVEVIIKTMEKDVDGPINLGSVDEMKIIDVANLIIELTNSKSEVLYVERPQDDPSRRKPDLSKANSVLGWSPKTNFKDGLKLTIEYFRSL